MGTGAAEAADGFPARAVTVIVPTAPGGSIDTVARVAAEKLAQRWGRPVVVENRAGAAMRIGATAVARALPDGYTLLFAHDGTMAMNPVVYPDLAYDPQKDFAPLGLLASIAEAVFVNVRVPARSLEELLALARREPGRLNHASGGNATLLALELFKSLARVDIADVPYRGGAPAVNAVIAGDVDLCIADIATAHAAFQTDRVRALAVTSISRQKSRPLLPTVDQSGVPGYEVNTWVGAFAPAQTPAEVTARIEEGLVDALGQPDVRARLEALGMEVRSGRAAELRRVLAGDIAKWRTLVSERGLRIDPR